MTTRDANKEKVGASPPPARRSGGMERLRSRYGPWAVVTGASSGIGRGMALQLADAGLSVVLVARSQDALDKLAADLCSRPGVEARTVAVDLALEAGTVAVVVAIAANRAGSRRGLKGRDHVRSVVPSQNRAM